MNNDYKGIVTAGVGKDVYRYEKNSVSDLNKLTSAILSAMSDVGKSAAKRCKHCACVVPGGCTSPAYGDSWAYWHTVESPIESDAEYPYCDASDLLVIKNRLDGVLREIGINPDTYPTAPEE